MEQKPDMTAISIEIPVSQIRLLGQHNYFDIGIAYAVCRLFKNRRYRYLSMVLSPINRCHTAYSF